MEAILNGHLLRTFFEREDSGIVILVIIGFLGVEGSRISFRKSVIHFSYKKTYF
jgi:hypothetical protein